MLWKDAAERADPDNVARMRAHVDGDEPGGDVIHVAGDTYLRGEQGRAEQALGVGLDGGVRVGDRDSFQRCLAQSGRRGGLPPEAGVG
jgi:hypothetical protein